MKWTQSRDLNRLLDDAVKTGWLIDRTRGDHVRAKSPRGSTVFVSTTPSDRRTVLNTRARIRRIDQQEQQL